MSLQGVGGSSDAFVGVAVDNSDLYAERRLHSSVEWEQHTRAFGSSILHQMGYTGTVVDNWVLGE